MSAEKKKNQRIIPVSVIYAIRMLSFSLFLDNKYSLEKKIVSINTGINCAFLPIINVEQEAI
jgi:hypothetical protein